MEKRAHCFVAGLLGGAVVGAMVVLLFTPLSGREIRRLLPERGQSLRGEVGEVNPAMRWILGVSVEAIWQILDSVLLLGRGDLEKLFQKLGLASEWLVIG